MPKFKIGDIVQVKRQYISDEHQRRATYKVLKTTYSGPVGVSNLHTVQDLETGQIKIWPPRTIEKATK